MATLVFVDTNIWLDFYRVSGRHSDLSLLDRIDQNRDRIISTAQVEMEFKKNRPGAIVGAHAQLKAPDVAPLPAFLDKSKQSSGLETGAKRIKSQLKTLRDRTENVLRQPTRYDPVYKVAQRLFRETGPSKLHRTHKSRDSIRRRALKRFMLGYPPRKSSDTSIGDAVNWEWIVRCASETGSDIVIVSRDSDFGVQFGGRPHLNDWLLQEFRERVGKRRRIELTGRLAEGLKRAKVTVSKEEEKSEEEFLKTLPAVRTFPAQVSSSAIASFLEAKRVADDFNRSWERKAIEEIAQRYAELGIPLRSDAGSIETDQIRPRGHDPTEDE